MGFSWTSGTKGLKHNHLTMAELLKLQCFEMKWILNKAKEIKSRVVLWRSIFLPISDYISFILKNHFPKFRQTNRYSFKSSFQDHVIMIFDKLNLTCIDSFPLPKVTNVKSKNLSFLCSKLNRVLLFIQSLWIKLLIDCHLNLSNQRISFNNVLSNSFVKISINSRWKIFSAIHLFAVTYDAHFWQKLATIKHTNFNFCTASKYFSCDTKLF